MCKKRDSSGTSLLLRSGTSTPETRTADRGWQLAANCNITFALFFRNLKGTHEVLPEHVFTALNLEFVFLLRTHKLFIFSILTSNIIIYHPNIIDDGFPNIDGGTI
jgi:hypothetical protein